MSPTKPSKPWTKASSTPIGPTYCIRRRQKPGRETGAWEVIIHRNAQVAAYRHFGDGKYGGYEAAFHAAVAYRDQMLQQHPPTHRALINQRLRVTNRTGYPGVIRVSSKAGKLTGFAAETVIRRGQKKLRTYYPVAEYGERQAFELAVAERQRQLQHVSGGVTRVAPHVVVKVPIPAPAPVSEQELIPRRKPTAPKRAPRIVLDPDREERVAQAILRRYGRVRPRQSGAPELRGITRYRRRDRKHPGGGWQVTIYCERRRLGTRIFMDRLHGGAAAAFELACQARDEIIRHHWRLLQASGFTGILLTECPEGGRPGADART